jgi:tripartite-type tricarboxylate transporter receptor subunit TctC
MEMMTQLRKLIDSLNTAPAMVIWSRKSIAQQAGQPNSSPTPLTEVIARENAHPEKMRCASSGNAGFGHWAAELFWQTAKPRELHAPCNGAVFTMATLLRWQRECDCHRIGQGDLGLTKEPQQIY